MELELEQLSLIIDEIKKDNILLMNESFVTTTEKEGSQIAKEVINVFKENNIAVVFVTHLFIYYKYQ